MARGTFNGIKPIVAFVLGAPGSGKGTQCKLICQEFGFAHLSAGDLLRAERSSPDSQYGELIEKHIVEGTIVPVEITCRLIENAMIKHCQDLKKNAGECAGNSLLTGKFLIDGFPRNMNNLLGWNSQMSQKVNEAFVLFLDCPIDVCLKRCIARGQSGSKRSDDNVESLRKRLVTYKNDTMPIIEHYTKLNMVRRIETLQSPEEVHSNVRKLFTDL